MSHFMGFSATGALIAAVCFEAMGQICFKLSAARAAATTAGHSGLAFAYAVMRSGWVVAGIIAYVFELFLWLAALRTLPLSLAYPLLTTSYCVVAIGSHFVLKESLSGRTVFGIALITIGAALLSSHPMPS
jgi:multidrug transporter EmrE-like cation transporter